MTRVTASFAESWKYLSKVSFSRDW